MAFAGSYIMQLYQINLMIFRNVVYLVIYAFNDDTDDNNIVNNSIDIINNNILIEFCFCFKSEGNF